MARAAVERDLLNPAVRLQQNGAAGGFIKSTAFHADKAVFHQIQQTHAMLAADLVQPGQDRGRRQSLTIDRDRIAAFKSDFHIIWGIGRLFHRGDALIDKLGRFLGRVLQHFAL